MPQQSHFERQKLSADRAAIREAMVDLLHTWAAVENRFAALLRNIINDQPGDIAFAIYFTPSSPKDLEPFAFAGIWEFARLGGEEILSTGRQFRERRIGHRTAMLTGCCIRETLRA